MLDQRLLAEEEQPCGGTSTVKKQSTRLTASADMTGKEMVALFRESAEQLVKTIEAKNHDYAGGGAFDNFDFVEELTHGEITAEMGIMVRLCDKFTRTYNLLHGPAAVKDESFSDTCRDAAAYFLLLALRHEHRVRSNVTRGSVRPKSIVRRPRA